MALWKNDSWILFIARSGLQYCSTLSCTGEPTVILSSIRSFYQARRATSLETTTPNSIVFRRGSKRLSQYSCVLPLSERWPEQTINVTLRKEESKVTIDISYDVRVHFTTIMRPCALVTETRELQELLKSQYESTTKLVR